MESPGDIGSTDDPTNHDPIQFQRPPGFWERVIVIPIISNSVWSVVNLILPKRRLWLWVLANWASSVRKKGILWTTKRNKRLLFLRDNWKMKIGSDLGLLLLFWESPFARSLLIFFHLWRPHEHIDNQNALKSVVFISKHSTLHLPKCTAVHLVAAFSIVIASPQSVASEINAPVKKMVLLYHLLGMLEACNHQWGGWRWYDIGTHTKNNAIEFGLLWKD